MALISGVLGSVSVGGVSYSFGKWKLSIRANRPKMNNFKSGFQRVVGGLLSAALDVEGPWDVGAMPLTAGNMYTFQLGVSPSVFIVVNVVIDLEPSNDVEDAPRLRVSGDSDGSFTYSVV